MLVRAHDVDALATVADACAGTTPLPPGDRAGLEPPRGRRRLRRRRRSCSAASFETSTSTAGPGVARAGGAVPLPVLARRSARPRGGRGPRVLRGDPRHRRRRGAHERGRPRPGDRRRARRARVARPRPAGGRAPSGAARGLELGYRHSALAPDEVVVGGRRSGSAEAIPAACEATHRRDRAVAARAPARRRRTPARCSATRRATPPGRLIDAAGLQGPARRRAPWCREKHANFFQAEPVPPPTTCVDARGEVRRRVRSASGVELDARARHGGFDDDACGTREHAGEPPVGPAQEPASRRTRTVDPRSGTGGSKVLRTQGRWRLRWTIGLIALRGRGRVAWLVTHSPSSRSATSGSRGRNKRRRPRSSAPGRPGRPDPVRRHGRGRAPSRAGRLGRQGARRTEPRRRSRHSRDRAPPGGVGRRAPDRVSDGRRQRARPRRCPGATAGAPRDHRFARCPARRRATSLRTPPPGCSRSCRPTLGLRTTRDHRGRGCRHAGGEGRSRGAPRVTRARRGQGPSRARGARPPPARRLGTSTCASAAPVAG